MRKFLALAVGFLMALELALLITGSRVLVSERRVLPGQEPGVEGYRPAAQTQLVCTYFDGRALRTSVLWYSSNNIMGRDSCSFFVRPHS